MDEVPMGRRFGAELIGTFWLVFGGCGSAVLAAHFLSSDPSPVNLGIGFLGVALAFGLTVMTMAYTIGHISGCHLNPAVTLGLIAGGRANVKYFLPYVTAQIIGGLLAAFVLYSIANQQPGNSIIEGGFACNGYTDLSPTGTGDHSPGHYPMMAAMMSEIVLTAMFLFIIMGATDKRAPQGFAPIAIGLGLTLIHLIGIPVDNLSVNPARSIATAVLIQVNGQGWAFHQLWLFIVAPLIGGSLGGFVYKAICGEAEQPAEIS
jgi:aquaporin Z